MRMIAYLDWHGTMDELKQYDKAVEKACKETGIKFMGRWAPHNKKYHWAYFYEGDDFEKWMSTSQKIPRDYAKVSHMVIDYFTK